MPNVTPGLDTIVTEAVEIADVAGRAAYLARACGPDAALRARVEALVAAHFRAGSFLERPAEPPRPSARVSTLAAPVRSTAAGKRGVYGVFIAL